MGNITFENMPRLIEEICERLKRIEAKLEEINVPSKAKDGYLDISEAAKELNLSESTVYGKVCRNELPFYKKGK